jgi:hypothetical protein
MVSESASRPAEIYRNMLAISVLGMVLSLKGLWNMVMIF